ncbi:MAG: type II toxin-antitoxin system VapC family toxin [Chromatiales bacterium]|nr:type II toxin-antitoxin system VapC family toxin [Chromatiales bacterium]
MKKPSIYIETSVVSYLVAEPSINIVTAARQALTRQWWNERRQDYDLYISEFVVSEAASGGPLMANRRLAALAGLTEIELTEPATDLARMLVEEGPLPARAALDALHIAIAVAGGMEYLLTWNFKHLANATIRNQIERKCRSGGFEPPIICTPEELSGE